MHNVLGGTIDPHASYLLLRGMKTLELRVQRQNATAAELARRLEGHPRVTRVHYPGLESHPDHAIAVAQMSGYGGVVSFEVEGDLWRTASFIDAVRLPYIAPSLGGVESLIEQPTIVRCGPALRGAGAPAAAAAAAGGHPWCSPPACLAASAIQHAAAALRASIESVCAPPPPPRARSYWDQGPEKRAQVGIKDNLIRFSCGIEAVEDIWADFQQAFDRLK
jgi:cystathionine beta-lyase/cystathionine gamma-synthase